MLVTRSVVFTQPCTSTRVQSPDLDNTRTGASGASVAAGGPSGARYNIVRWVERAWVESTRESGGGERGAGSGAPLESESPAADTVVATSAAAASAAVC